MDRKKVDYTVLKQITILVVEDDESEREEIGELLDIYFDKCYRARNGREGVDLYRKKFPDIVLTDLGMHTMDGFGMAKKIREINQDASIVLHTIFTTVDIFLRAIEHKISGYVVKPTNAKILLDTLLRESKNILKEKELKKEKRLMQTVSNEFPDPMMIVDLDHNVLFANSLVRGGEEWQSKEPIKYYDALCGIGNANKKQEVENDSTTQLYENVNENGDKVYYDIKTVPLKDEKRKIYAFLKVIQDKTDDKNREIELEHLANYDTLTGLPNRILLFDRLEQAILRSKRSKTSFALMFIDLDEFKRVNDIYGHNIGDDLLRTASYRMKSIIRKIDTVARFGGDEFIVILESISDTQQVISIARDILSSLKKEFELINDIKVNISCSIGIEMYNPIIYNVTKEKLMHNADVAMYEAKESGKNTYKFFRESLSNV